ncbi:MAG: hypothetical protein J0H88_08545 [Sphingomonadales bacterium]|nr:hypothetical protein [Sphingomonadales bacterium]
MSARRTLGVNILRHDQNWTRRGKILPMGTPIYHNPIQPMRRQRGLAARLLGL